MEEPDMAGWQIGGPNSRQESAHFKVCLRQRGGFLAAPIHWLLTAQQVRSCRLNCYPVIPFSVRISMEIIEIYDILGEYGNSSKETEYEVIYGKAR